MIQKRHRPWWVWTIAIPILPIMCVLCLAVLFWDGPYELWYALFGRRFEKWKAERDAASRGALGVWEE